MKFPPFDYAAPESLSEVIDILEGDEDAKLLAGGQSLLPLLALRLARPSVLVDLQHLGMDEVAVASGGSGRDTLHVGSMTSQDRLASDPLIATAAPLIAAASRHVGHPATRNLGTIGGSLAHSDPSAELPAALVALGATVAVTGPEGTRQVACRELSDGYFTTTLDPTEVITEIRISIAGPGHGAAWCEWAARSGDFAEAGFGVAVELDAEGVCAEVMAAGCAVGATPLEMGELLEPSVVGARRAEPDLLRQVAETVRRHTAPAGDDKSELASLLAARAVKRAFDAAAQNLSRR